jgi:hypothetical protein
MAIVTTIKDLKIGDHTKVITSGRFKGACVGRDKEGYYACLHQNLGRSRSYKSSKDIPTRKVEALLKTLKRSS